MPFVTCNKFNQAVSSLSTTSSTGLSSATVANSAVSSLSTTVVAKADLVDGKVPATQLPSFVVKDEGAILTTAATELNFTGGGVVATSVGGQVTVKVVGSTASTVLPTAAAPTAPPAAGEPTKAVNTNGEVFEYIAGVGWVLTAKGYTNLIVLTNTAVVPNSTVFCTYTAQRNGVYQIGGSFDGALQQDPENDGKAYCRIRINGSYVSTGADSILASSSIGDGIVMSTGTVAIELNVGDVVTLEVQLFTFQVGLTASGEGSLSIHAVK